MSQTRRRKDMKGVADGSINTHAEADDMYQSDEPKRNWFMGFIYSIPHWKLGTWLRLLFVAVIIGAFIVLFAVAPIRDRVVKGLTYILDWISTHKIIGAITFIYLYIFATVLLLPGLILTLGGGFVFGLWLGILLVVIGSNLGAFMAFLLGRTALRSWITEKISKFPIFAAIDSAIEDEGWKIILLVRLAPVLPFNLLNYGLALTKVKSWQYVVFSVIGMLPGTAMYVYFGSAFKNLASLASGSVPSTAKWITLGVSGVVIIVTVVFITFIAKRAIGKALAKQKEKEARAGEDGPLLEGDDVMVPPPEDDWLMAPVFSLKWFALVLAGLFWGAPGLALLGYGIYGIYTGWP